MREFGGSNIHEDFKHYSNIAFVNGALDPWLAGCVQEQVNEDLPVLTVKNGAHHTDSFLPRDTDEAEGSNLVEVRAQIEKHLEKWMDRYQKQLDSVKGALMQ